MKKLLASILASIMVLAAFTSCGKTDTDSNNAQNSVSESSESKKEDDTSNDAVKLIDISLTNEEYAFAVDKDQKDLLESVNAFIKEMKYSRKFDNICNKYFGEGTPEGVQSAKLDSKKDQLVVATNAEFAPFEYKKENDDKFYGIDMEVASMLAKNLGKELVIQDMDFDSVCQSVSQHKCDIAIAALTINDERKKTVNFSNMYYKASQKIITKGSDTTFDGCMSSGNVEAMLKSMDKTKKAGVQKGTTAQKYLEGDADSDFQGFDVTCVTYDNASLAVQDLVDGKIDFVIVDSAPADSLLNQFNKK